MSPEEDFRAFVAARQAALRRSAGLLTGDAASAEDLVQTALIKCWPRWPALMQRGTTEAYVRRVIVTTHVSARRRRWRAEVPSEVVPDRAAAETADEDLVLSVRQALQDLPARQRAAVVLRYFDDLTEQQTALVLGCAVGTVKSQTAKALARLRDNPGLDGLHIPIRQEARP